MPCLALDEANVPGSVQLSTTTCVVLKLFPPMSPTAATLAPAARACTSVLGPSLPADTPLLSYDSTRRTNSNPRGLGHVLGEGSNLGAANK
jgi:hypothetical protein